MSEEYGKRIREQLEEMTATIKRNMERVFAADKSATAPNIPEGSLRDFVNGNVYTIQEYKWGVWNTILIVPFDEEHITRLEKFIETSAVVQSIVEKTSAAQDVPDLSPEKAWPWPTTTPVEETPPTPSYQVWPFPEPKVDDQPEVSAYDKAMEILRK